MRSNDFAAEALGELADLLAISGGDPYRVRAYEKAAQSVAGYHLGLDGLDRKGLMAIPAVGAHTADKVLELRETGRITALEELRAQMPAGLRALLGVPGLGPKRAHQVHVELGISSMPELLAALHDQRLRDLKGWGETSERNLARAIRQVKESGGRTPLAVALDLAEGLVTRLATLPEVHQVTYAGSLRRMRDTIGDVDLLVASDHPGPVMDPFCALETVDRVLAHGPTKSSVVTTRGIQVDLRVVSPEVWGAALLYFFDVDAVFAAAALEIDAFPDRLDLDDDLARRAREHGVTFAIDTDAHAVPHLDHIRFGVATAQRAWIEPHQVINTWPLDRLRRFLATGRHRQRPQAIAS